MALVNAYASTSDLKTRLHIQQADISEDALLESYLNIASRRIDTWTGRRFYVATQTRYYEGSNLACWWPERPSDYSTRPYDWISPGANYRTSPSCAIDDAVSITSIATDTDGDHTYAQTWTAADYYLVPKNGPLESTPRPYELIRASDLVATPLRFPNSPNSVKVVGSFGYSATPPWEIVEATLRQAARLYKLRDALPVSGDAIRVVNGSVVEDRKHYRADPDLDALIEPYRKHRKPAGVLW